MMTKRIYSLLPALVVGGALAARADIFTTDRTISYNITFSDSARFSDAFANITNTEVIGPGSFGTDTETGGYASLNTGVTFFATGGVSISPMSAPPGQSQITTTINVTGAGTYGFHEPVPVYSGRLSGLNYFPSPLARFPYNGFYSLEIFSPSSGFLDAGGTWITNISVLGDWSKSGDADVSGTHLLFYLDPLWTITSDFVYHPVSNETTFSVINTNYPGADSDDNGPFPVILLTGAPVPEPGSMGLIGGGLATACAFITRRLKPASEAVYSARPRQQNCSSDWRSLLLSKC